MSTQLIGDEHIRVLIWAGLRPHPDGALTWSVSQDGSRHVHRLVEENAAHVGTMLHDQNVAAYEDRYGEDESLDLDRSYTHTAPRHAGWTPVDLFRAIEFYVYQSFHDEDHDEAASVEALQFCVALARRVGTSLPGWGGPEFPTALIGTSEWESIPWGIGDETRPSQPR